MKLKPYFSRNPQMVVFRLDAETMRFTEVHGNPFGLTGFASERWLEDGFWPGQIHPDDRESVLTFCKRCFERRQGHELEYRVLHADGSVVWIHEIAEFESNDTKVVSGFIMNITQRVQQEQDLGRVLGLKDELLRIVVEDLSQPVNKISSFGDMLERHLAMRGDDVGSDLAVGLREGVQELGDIIDGLTGVEANADESFDQITSRLAALRERRTNLA